MSTASNWIGVQTCVHGFDSLTPYKSVVSKTAKAFMTTWLSIYDHLTDVGGQTGGCQQLAQLSTQQESSLKWIDPSKWWCPGDKQISFNVSWWTDIFIYSQRVRNQKHLHYKFIVKSEHNERPLLINYQQMCNSVKCRI